MDNLTNILHVVDQYGSLVLFVILISLGFFFGRYVEKKHYKSIIEREKYFGKLPAVTMKDALEEAREIEKAELVYGSVVVSGDYFKIFVAGLKNIFGGRLTTYEALLDRAKREAILRMKQSAKKSDIILNLRIQTSAVGSRPEGAKNSVTTVEVIAYGTAITYKKDEIRT